jgi:pimeloyl-ACP methyl ester carboxylesterase
MATGMGGTKDSGLLPFAEAFAGAGLDALLFDYRGFGESAGEPRQLAWPPRHREDLAAAVEFARTLDGVDAGRIVLWGWSWGGSHCLYEAAARPEGLAAAVLVGPDSNGVATLRHLISQVGMRWLLPVNAAVARDMAAQVRGRPPVRIPTVGPPGSTAVLTTKESEPRYTALAGPTWRNEVAARVALAEPANRGIARAKHLRCPVLVQCGEYDSIAPASSIRQVAWEAKGRSEMREYPCGHFDYLLDLRDRVIEDELSFLRRHVGSRQTASPSVGDAGGR